ncbi:MAG: PKD domain-containing protein [Bacteroidales bacterium]|nr:PKD domain-containing protein [Bacteroidales bacterium]
MKKKHYILLLQTLAILLFSLLLISGYSQSRGQLLVPQTFATIQAGINAAGIGDTVVVSPGFYNENINFNGKPIMVASQYLFSGDSSQIIQTIIDGNNIGPVVTFNSMESENSLLVGFTLRDGQSTFGGGVYCANADPVLSNLIIKNCNADYGAGIYLYESNAYIWRVALTGNQATYYGGAISCDTYAYPAIYSTRIIDNAAQYGGGIHCYLSHPYISDFEISGNNAEYGAGIYLYQSSPYIWDGIIAVNSATNYGGGIMCDYYSQPLLSYLQISSNTSAYGAGVHLSFSDIVIKNLTVVANQANYGGGIYCYYANPAIENTIVAFNSGQYGVYVYEGIPDINYCDFWDNESGDFFNTPDEIGVNVQKNINNDSCDVFFNIRMNPNFIDLTNKNFHLLSSSRCIDAGNPDSPEDADGSTADIGKYYFAQTFVANFGADITYGLPPLSVQFYDQSTGSPTSYSWDFDNDGVIDSYSKNPQWTYQEMGDYSVSLSTSRGFLSDKRVKQNFIKVYYISQPSITAVEDVPNDQGAWVEVNFLRSVYDTDTLADRGTESYTVQYNTGNGWVSVNSGAAYGEDEYTILCHTPFDSTATSNGLIDFRVIASMDEGNFASLIVQGYSVDNLSPRIPTDLMVEISEDNYKLSWQPVSDPDLQYYAVYISDEEGIFGTEPDYLTAATTIENISIEENPGVVAVKAVDFSGNQSQFSDPVDAPLAMTVFLQEGWNSLSGFVVPHNPALEAMFSGMENELIFLNNLEGYWYPGQNQNTLIEWNAESGYQIKVAQGAFFSITGYFHNDQILQLSAGWNLIPVLSNCPVAVDEFMGLLKGKVRVIKEAGGLEVAWPEQGIITLLQLMPGKAYLINMNEDATLSFPECD